jgi:hypothetical protein
MGAFCVSALAVPKKAENCRIKDGSGASRWLNCAHVRTAKLVLT